MRLEGIWFTVVAAAMGIIAAVVMMLTATAAEAAVLPLMIMAAGLHLGAVILGSARWVAVMVVPMVVAVMLESGFGDNPSWIRSIVLGCWIFVTIEVSWEAIERRDGAGYTRAASARRMEEVATVVGVALLMGAIATALTAIAPARSVALQAIVLALLLAALVTITRQVTAS